MSHHSHSEHRPPADQDPATLGEPPTGTTLFGNFYPMNDILAVVHERSDGERAVQALKGAGVPESDVDLLDGAWFAEAVRGLDRRGGIASRLAMLLPMDERLLVRRYVEQAEKGHFVIVVHAEDQAQIQRASGVLAHHGAHEIRHYGGSYITDL